ALVRALNNRLPPEVRVLAAAEAPPDFHARFDARAKSYCYRIWNSDVASPFQVRYAWHMIDVLDPDAMAAAARLVEGSHDFAAFQGSKPDTQTTQRVITRSEVAARSGPEESPLMSGGRSADGTLLTYTITGTGFLRHMVRILVGTLVDIGRGQR